MIALKIKLQQDSVGALHAEFIDGLNSVSQNNEGKNVVEVILNGFELQTEEILQIAYATSTNENDPMTESIGFNFMEKNYERNSWLAEIDRFVLDRRGVWYLGLRVVTETDGIIQTVSNQINMLEFTVNATIHDQNGNYPTKGDVSALYQTAVNAVAQSEKVATETATRVASEIAENVANEKLTPVIQVTNNELGASIELLLNNKTYELYSILRAKNGVIISQQTVDLPLEEMIVNAYQNEGGNLVIVLKNGEERTIELGALIKGLVSQKDFDDFVESKGQPDGIATLNNEGKVPETQLPPLNYLPLTGGTVNGTVEADDFTATSTGFYIGETIYEDGAISYGDNEFSFPDEGGTLALQEPIDTQIELLKQAITQSGIMYTRDNTASWNERVTAGGANVLDGSTAILKKVVGSTVACKNLWNGTWTLGTINTNTGVEETNTASLVSSFVPVIGGNTIAISGNLADLYMCFVYDKDYNFLHRSGWGSKTVEIEAEGKFIRIMQYQSTVEPTNVQVEYGTTATEYQPYFTGLKSASFGGIESTNADGTETSTLVFPLTETPKGTTIDFVQKAVIANGVSTPFTSAQLANLIFATDSNGNNLGAVYTIYNGGNESVQGNSNAEYFANNELTINYVYITEVQ